MKTVIAALIVAGLAAAPAAQAKEPQDRERFSAFAVNLDGPNGAATAVLQITIDRWSTPDERRKLESVLTENGPEALLSALQKTKPVGRIRTTGNLGYDLRFAYQYPLATGGRRIVIGTDRPLTFYEASTRPRSADYPITILELRVDDKGQGSGQMVVASRVTSLGESIELENYNATPVQLMQVQLDK
jgi:hypothetical protein